MVTSVEKSSPGNSLRPSSTKKNQEHIRTKKAESKNLKPIRKPACLRSSSQKRQFLKFLLEMLNFQSKAKYILCSKVEKF